MDFLPCRSWQKKNQMEKKSCPYYLRTAAVHLSFRTEKKTHNALHAADICRLIVVVVVVVISFYFICFQLFWVFFGLLSIGSIKLRECVSAGLRLTFENVEWILLSSKTLDIGPVIDTWQWAESASYTEIRWKKTCPSANAHVRVMCSFIWCDAIRAFDIRAIRNVNECKANEWNTPTGNCVQRQRRSWLRLNEFHCEHMFGHRHKTIHSLLDSGK